MTIRIGGAEKSGFPFLFPANGGAARRFEPRGIGRNAKTAIRKSPPIHGGEIAAPTATTEGRGKETVHR